MHMTADVCNDAESKLQISLSNLSCGFDCDAADDETVVAHHLCGLIWHGFHVVEGGRNCEKKNDVVTQRPAIPPPPPLPLDNTNRSDSSTKTIPLVRSTRWKSSMNEWKIIGDILPQLSPFQIHAIASQAMQFGMNHDDNNNNNNNNNLPFHSSCFLLCCYALHQCPMKPLRFLKRWRSLLLETIRLYQRYIQIRSPSGDSNKNNMKNKKKSCILRWKVYMCCYYLIPNVWHVRQELLPRLKDITTADDIDAVVVNFDAACVAGIIAILSTLLDECHKDVTTEITTETKSEFNSSSSEIIMQSWHEVINGRWDLIWCHPWRHYHLQSSSSSISYLDITTATTTKEGLSSFESHLSFWSCYRERKQQQQEQQQQHDDDDENYYSDEFVCFIDTVWNGRGVALSAAIAFNNKQQYRPLIWSIQHTWKLFFPHVSVLLERRQQQQEQQSEEEMMWGEEEQQQCDNRGGGGGATTSTAIQMCDQSNVIGFHFLQHDLLPIIPDQSLVEIISTTLQQSQQQVKRRSSKNIILRTFQCLTNHIMDWNALRMMNQNSDDEMISSTTVITPIKNIPDATDSFLLMKILLQRYIPKNQITIVKELIESCPPHVMGIQPKLLDLLRNFVNWYRPQYYHNNKNNDPLLPSQEADDEFMLAHNDAWQYMDELWGRIMINCNFHKNDQTLGNKTIMLAVSTKTDVAWDRLVGQVELSVSLLSLVRLWILVNQRKYQQQEQQQLLLLDDDDDINQIKQQELFSINNNNMQYLNVQSLRSLHNLLQINLQEWTTTTTTRNIVSRPEEYFRLNLLDNALEHVLCLL